MLARNPSGKLARFFHKVDGIDGVYIRDTSGNLKYLPTVSIEHAGLYKAGTRATKEKTSGEDDRRGSHHTCTYLYVGT